MPCDTRLRAKQTISQRKAEVRSAVGALSAGLASGRIKPVIGRQGAIAFQGWDDTDRNAVTDACGYRMLMVHGSALAKMAIARAEQMAGRTVDKQVVGQGAHSHDGGATWHDHKG